MKLLEKYENIIITDYEYNNNIYTVLYFFVRKIGILNSIHTDDIDFVEEKILTCFKKIKKLLITDEKGICCFCKEGCNPLSQSCGSCIRQKLT
jgi:hypothetical protein